MMDAGYGWAELLNRYLFHWTPSKAIWIGGQTLSWDARCAGIYIEFGAGVIGQLAAQLAAWGTPSARVRLLTALLMLPLFADVFTIHFGFKSPFNDTRYFTGLLWRMAFSVYLLPAFLILIRSRDPEETGTTRGKLFALLLVVGAGALFLKNWDHLIAYGVLEALGIFGCLSLAGILAIGLFRAALRLALRHRPAQIAILLATHVLLSACAPAMPALRSGSCDDADFAPSPYACLACQQEMCVDGKIVRVDDLTPTAPVDDWAEERFCLQHPFNCYRAYALKQKLERWQKGLVGTYWADDGLHNGLGDAARHAYFTCELTEQFNATFARTLGAVHEEDSEYLIFVRMGIPGNPCCEKMTDLHNNEIGIGLAGRPGTCEEKTLRSLHLLRHSLCTTKDKVLER